MSSETPRTDHAFSGSHLESGFINDFARQLERDLIAAKAEIERLKATHELLYIPEGGGEPRKIRCEGCDTANRDADMFVDWLTALLGLDIGDAVGIEEFVKASLPRTRNEDGVFMFQRVKSFEDDGDDDAIAHVTAENGDEVSAVVVDHRDFMLSEAPEEAIDHDTVPRGV